MPPELHARFTGIELCFNHLDEDKRFTATRSVLIFAMRRPATSRAASPRRALFASNVRARNPTPRATRQ